MVSVGGGDHPSVDFGLYLTARASPGNHPYVLSGSILAHRERPYLMLFRLLFFQTLFTAPRRTFALQAGQIVDILYVVLGLA
jgi:hypothetical protein